MPLCAPDKADPTRHHEEVSVLIWWRRITPEMVITSRSDARLVLAADGAPFGLGLFFLGAVGGVPVVAVVGWAVALVGIVTGWIVGVRVSPRVAHNRVGLIPRLNLYGELGLVILRPDVVRRAVAISRRSQVLSSD